MAVTIPIDLYAQYHTERCPIKGCLNGGQDYKSIDPGAKNVEAGILATRGWCGDNISNACQITKIRITGDVQARDKFDHATGINGDCDFTIMMMVRDHSETGGISGNIISNGLQTLTAETFGKTANDSWNGFNYASNVSGDLRANSLFPAVKPVFWNGNRVTTVRYYIKNLKFTITRTRACYITFKGDGVTESTTMYDYGTVPSYGSAPTRYGYTFKGWSDGSTTYSGTLPTAYEQDVTYTAVWEKTPCTITYDGNGSTGGSVAPQLGYIGESLNLQVNGFVKKWNVTFYSNEEPDIVDDSLDEFQTLVSSATFNGWCTADGAIVGGSGDSYTPEVDITLYANWGEMPAITTPIPPRDGYTLLGWYTERIGGTKVANSGGSYTPPRERVVLYAHWKRNSTNRIYIGTKKPKFYKGKKPIRSIYLGTSLIYRVFLPKISYDRIGTLGHLLVPQPGYAPNTYTLLEANLENAEGDVSYALYSDSKCKTPVGAGITFDENTRQVTISNAAKDTVAAQDTYKDGLAKFYVKATYKNLSAVGEITLENYKVTATFSYRNIEDAYIDKSTEVYYGASVEEFANGITDFWLPENDENYHYTIIGWVDLTKKSTIKNVKGDTIFDLLFNAKPHEIDPNIAGYEKKVPTCTEAGYTKGYCGYCAKQQDGYKGLIQVELPATGHTDTNDDGVCDVCGESTIQIIDSGACGDNLTYTLYNNGVLTISGTGDMQNSSFGWDKNKIKSVIINDGVTSIGDNAFNDCTGLTSVTISNSVTNIGYSAFKNCTGLTGITIPNGVMNISNYAFNGCTSLTNITIPTSVTNIGYSAFDGCTSLTSITVPDSVISIGGYAFYDTAYYNNNSNWENDVLYVGSHLIHANRSMSGTYNIKAGTKTIAGFAFRLCESLTSVEIPNSVTSIGDSTFQSCTSLTSVEIPNSVTSIGSFIFYGCSSLTSVKIGNRITSIGDRAFQDCTSLTEVDFSTCTDIPVLESPDVFSNTPVNLAIKVPSDLVDQWKAATNWDAYADKIKGI